MANRETAQTFGAETLEHALAAVSAVEKFLTEVDLVGGYLTAFSLDVHLDGETIGRVEVQDDFACFVANGDWNGFTVEAMG